MAEYNRLTMDNKQFITEKAKTKNDGVFTIRGIAYRVRDGRATHYATNGEILLNCGGFVVILGTYKEHWNAKRTLLNING